MRRLSFVGVAALAGAAMLVLPGCLVIKSQLATQLNQIGKVRITTTFCMFMSGSANCPNGGNSGQDGGGRTGQGLVGYRIPTAADAPGGILSTDTTIAMTQSASYTAELQRVSPAPAGQKWVGYISQVTSLPAGTEKTLSPEFTLARGADGSPFQTPFLYRVVVGTRDVAADAPSTRPVACGNSVSDPTLLNSSYTMCFNSPAPAEIATNLTRTTRDLGIIAPTAAVAVQRGQTGVLTFRAKQSGASTGPTFTISATTTLAGATAAPNVINYVPNPNQDAPVSVLVTVPPNAGAGTYDVTLTATTGTGATLQTRAAVGKVTVPAGSTAPKTINARVPYRVAVGSRIRVLSMRVLGAPVAAKIAVSCRKGNCRLPLINGTRVRTRISRGKPVNLASIFSRQVLRPGVTIEVRITKPGFLGRFFRFTFSRTNVKTLQCQITLAGRTRKCVRV
jgi:hypothetical protein